LIRPQFLRLWKAITPRRRAQLGLLLVVTLLASMAEVFSIGAVLPLLGVLSSPENVFQHELAQPLIQALGIGRPHDLLLPIVVLFCGATLTAAVVRMLAIWLRTRLTFATGADFSNEIYRRTLHQPYSVHLSRNSSEAIAGISGKVGAVISGVLSPLLVIVSNMVMLSVILLALLLVSPVTALAGFGGFGLIYLAIHKFSQSRLKANSRHVSESSTQLIKSLQEGLGGIRDVILDHSQEMHCAVYQAADSRLRRAQAENSVTAETPRYAIEALGMCFIAVLALHLAQQTEGFQLALPVLGAIAIVAQRMLPLLQQIYQGLANLSGSEQSLLDTLNLLEQPLPERAHQTKRVPMHFERAIECRQLGFRYLPDGPWVLRHLNLTVPKGARIGFIGTTGSGKSTLLDILMALLHPNEGIIQVDGQPLTPANSLSWQARIAHVPQSIYLSDASVAENIAFGVPSELVDFKRVHEAAVQAQIDEFIARMPQGYETLVGERGVRLSGGQRQRIGIARALYRQADVLVFDEATSALDNATEIAVMQAIEGLGPELTILIVAHRLTSLKQCDVIIELGNGRVLRGGSYTSIV
jgi:ABC-type multidrug transport system fused ATPase/permease subunit